MSKKKTKIETPKEAREKAKAELVRHIERQAKLTKACQEPARQVAPAGSLCLDDKPECNPGRRMSGLDAAAHALKHNFDGMSEGISAKVLTDTIIAADLWSPAGKTPAATLAAALMRECRKPDSRFQKVARGRFALRAVQG